MAETKHPETLVRILLGGGIGSGKSIATRRFEQLGATVVDADCLGHALLEPEGDAFEAVSERWPSVVIGRRIDRNILAEIVFGNPEQLTDLESITHPSIIRRISEIASRAGHLVVEIPLILDIAGEWMRVLMDANEDTRARRAIERGGNEVDVRRRMASQPTEAEWLAWADASIDNSRSIDELETQIDALWHGLRA